jgi:hypothetical protein
MGNVRSTNKEMDQEQNFGSTGNPTNEEPQKHVYAFPPATKLYQADCGEVIEAPVIPDWRDR